MTRRFWYVNASDMASYAEGNAREVLDRLHGPQRPVPRTLQQLTGELFHDILVDVRKREFELYREVSPDPYSELLSALQHSAEARYKEKEREARQLGLEQPKMLGDLCALYNFHLVADRVQEVRRQGRNLLVLEQKDFRRPFRSRKDLGFSDFVAYVARPDFVLLEKEGSEWRPYPVHVRGGAEIGMAVYAAAAGLTMRDNAGRVANVAHSNWGIDRVLPPVVGRITALDGGEKTFELVRYERLVNLLAIWIRKNESHPEVQLDRW